MPVTMKHVAERAGVSRMTVSRALRNDPNISTKTKKKVRRLCKEMGYRPDARISELMSHLRRARGTRVMETVALVRILPDVVTGSPMLSEKRQTRGCVERAEQLGMKIDLFDWKPSRLAVASLVRMLESRGIRGVILQSIGKKPVGIEELYSRFSVVSLGGGLPQLNHSYADHWQGMSTAVSRISDYGYKRVGLFLLPRLLAWTSDLWLSSFEYEAKRQGMLEYSSVVRGGPQGTYDEASFLAWMKETRPEAIISHIPAKDMIDSLRKAGYRVPEDVAVATVEWMPDFPEVAGVDQVSENLGRTAVDVTTRQLAHNETGIPPFAKKTLVPGVWRDGPSLPRKAG